MPATRAKRTPPRRPNSKTTNKVRPHASVGNIKAKNKRRLIVFSLIIVLGIIGLSYGAYYAWQQHRHNRLVGDYKVHAANYGAVILNNKYVTAHACWKPYSSSQPDEVWVLISRKSSSVNYSRIWVNLDKSSVRQVYGGQWWANVLQLHKIPVGRANIDRGAVISGEYFIREMGQAKVVTFGPSGAWYFYGGTPSRGTSITANYTGARKAAPGNPTLQYPLIKGLPFCNY